MRVLILGAVFLTGCATNYYLDRGSISGNPNTYSEQVSIQNPEIGKPYDILKRSGIYRLSDKSNSESRLKLNDIEPFPVCGNPLLVTLFTLGTVPVSLPYEHRFSYKITSQENQIEYEHLIPIYSRTSIWEWLFLPFSDDLDELLRQGLVLSKREMVSNRITKGSN